MRQSLLRLEIIAVLILLNGCVAVWGDAYQIESQTPDAIVINYDTNFIDDADIEKLASDHCQTYHKSALLRTHDKDMWNLSTDSFICQSLPANSLAAPK